MEEYSSYDQKYDIFDVIQANPNKDLVMKS